MTIALLRLAVRDLGHQRGFAVFFAFNLALGLVGAITLASLQASIDQTLSERSRSFLAADLRVASNRPLTQPEQNEIARVAKPIGYSRLIQLYTMVAAPGRSRLVEVRAIDEHFPLSGAMILGKAGRIDAATYRRLVAERGAWVDPSLPSVLDASLGDHVKLGGNDFTLSDTVVRDTGLSVRAVSFGPRIYIAAQHVRDTGLIRTGSRVEYQTLMQLAPDTQASSVAQELRQVLTDPVIRITSHEEATAAISGAYSRVTRYMGAISLISLCLAGLACAYAFRTYLAGRIADMAILMSLGAARRRAQGLLILELALLGAAAATIAVVLAAVALPIAGRSLADILPTRIDLAVGWQQVVAAYAIALLFGPLTCLPFLARLARLRVAELFQEHLSVELAEAHTADTLWYVPAALMIGALAWWQLRDLRQAAGFMAILVASATIVGVAARTLLTRAARVNVGNRLALKLALRQISPKRRASRTAFIALALAALLLALPAQMRALLDARLAPPAAQEIPSLFLFDIQPEQAQPLRVLVEEEGTRLQRIAPMVRARLDAINDEPVEQYQQARGSENLRSRSRLQARRYNLTYQAALAHTEELVAGHDFTGSWDFDSALLPEISMEVDFAHDLGVDLGDKLRFDVQGVPVEGRIVNLRSVDWNSMQPNFFVSFQPGVLEAAPAVFLASVPALPADQRTRLQNTIVEAFPNISLIDVTKGIDRALNLINQLQWALAATTLTSLLAGFLLVVAIARDEARARRADINLLKVLGAEHRILRRSVDTEFALLALAAASVGIFMAVTIGAVLAYGFFDTELAPASWPLLAVLAALPALTVITARLATRNVLSSRPSLLLR